MCIRDSVKTIESQALKQQIDDHQLALLKHDLDDVASFIAVLNNAEKHVHTFPEGSNNGTKADSLKDKSADSIMANNAVLTEHLVKLKQSLLQNMIDESELVFLRNEAASLHEDAISQVLLHIDNFDFKSALKYVDELLKTLET